MTRFRSFWVAAGSLALVAGLAAPAPATTAPDPLPVPTVMSALGDSITVAYDATRLLTAQPEYSWSTGTSSLVDSVYLKLKRKNRKLTAANYAVTGATIADLVTQASRVTAGTAKGRELVTVLLGANDACADSVLEMTPVDTFRTELRNGLNTLASRKVDVVVVASVPDVHQLWEDWRYNASARFIWGFAGICQSLLADPLGTATDDVDRRAAVDLRVQAYNAVIVEECAQLSASSPTTACVDDNGAVYATDFLTADVSTVDYFHPSIAGQKKLAATVYTAAGFPR
jgi:lysophospholipase L1-like esterase